MAESATVDYMESDFQRAEEARRAGKFAEALDRYLDLIARRLTDFHEASATSSLSAADLVVLERAADLAVLFGQDQGADDLFVGMAGALEGAGNFFGSDYIVVKRIHLALSSGRLHDARDLLAAMKSRIGKLESINPSEEGFDRWEATCNWDDATLQDRAVIFSRLYLVMGWLLATLGQYRDALLFLKRGLNFTGKDAPALAQRARAPLHLHIAAALMEQGEVEVARNKLDEIESKLDEQRQPVFYVRHLELKAKLSMLQGRFGAALNESLKILNYCQSHNFKNATVVATLNLSSALIFLNNTSVAQQLLWSVKQQASELNDQSVVARVELLTALAHARSMSLDSDVSIVPSVSNMRGRAADPGPEPKSFELKPEIPPAGNFLTLFEDRSLYLHWQLNDHNMRLATQLIQQLREAFGQSDSKLVLARLMALEGLIAYYSGDLEVSERLLKQSLAPLREMSLTPDLWQAQRVMGWCWARLGLPKAQRLELSAENQRLITLMTHSLPPAYQSIFLLNKWTDDEEFLGGEINRLVDLKKNMMSKSWPKKVLLRWSLMKRIHALLRYVNHHNESLAKEITTGRAVPANNQNFPSLWKLLWGHGRDHATISFLVLPDRVCVIHAGWRQLDFTISSVTRIQIRETVRRWHLLAKRAMDYRGGESSRASTEDVIDMEYLDTLVTGTRDLKPVSAPLTSIDIVDEANEIVEALGSMLQLTSIVESLPPRVRRLTIIPHDSLLGFPFAVINCRGTKLVERFNLSLDFGVSSHRSRGRRVPIPKALFVGVSEGAGEFPSLPGVEPEINEVERWSSTRHLQYLTLMNGAASKKAIVQQLDNCSLLHIACHGVFLANKPDCSGLVLVTKRDQVDILSLRDLSELNLSALNHVSLSSCWSADNFILPGRWIIGLPETLRRAGAQSILGSLWEVNDRFAGSFMARFYEYLNSYPKDEALRRTQLDCLQKEHSDSKGPILNDPTIDTKEPFYWASYTLYGDHRMLKL